LVYCTDIRAKEILVRSRLRFWKYPISIVLLLLVIAAFTFIYTLSDIAAAPYERIEKPDPGITEEPEPEDITEEPEPDDEAEEPFEEPEEIFIETGYITIDLEDAEIHQGYLLLINHNHSFTIPADLELVNIREAQTTNFRVRSSDLRLAASIMEPLDEMMAAFLSATGNRSVTIRDAFRDRNEQQKRLNDWIRQVGRREAQRWAALPGHSEHHTGLAFDFGIFSGGEITGFTGVGNTAWLRRNAHRYGFILRYPPNSFDITQTEHEPWHFRYVGFPHSIILHENNWVFEEYHENLRNHTYDNPFEFEHDDTLYKIYFVEGTSLQIPLECEFEISGNNIDGFIVTATMLPYDPDVIIDFEV